MYRQTEDEIMAAAGRLLTDRMERIKRDGLSTLALPRDYTSPRSRRSLQSCHRYNLHEPIPISGPKTKSYVPALSARLEDDRRITDGARRCARKLAEYTYLRDREGRTARITVTYLMHALGRCRRAVQTYLRELEAAGYISTQIRKAQTRMCVGLLIKLLNPLFADHHADGWPAKLIKPDAQKDSHNYTQEDIYERIPVHLWALRCMDGVWRAFNRAYPPGTLPIS
jgi:hypothetical protein